MRTQARGVVAVLAIALVWGGSHGGAGAAEPLRFRVRLEAEVSEEPVTGRLFVFLSQRGSREPRFGPDWLRPEPFFGLEVEEFQPGTSREIGDRADGFPDELSKLPPAVQVVTGWGQIEQAMFGSAKFPPSAAEGRLRKLAQARTPSTKPPGGGR